MSTQRKAIATITGYRLLLCSECKDAHALWSHPTETVQRLREGWIDITELTDDAINSLLLNGITS